MAVFQLCSRTKEKHSRQQNKTNRTHKGRKCTYILRGREKPLLEPRNKGSSNNGGEADKSHRPQETGRITMPAECADQLRNTEKKWRAAALQKGRQRLDTPHLTFPSLEAASYRSEESHLSGWSKTSARAKTSATSGSEDFVHYGRLTLSKTRTVASSICNAPPSQTTSCCCHETRLHLSTNPSLD